MQHIVGGTYGLIILKVHLKICTRYYKSLYFIDVGKSLLGVVPNNKHPHFLDIYYVSASGRYNLSAIIFFFFFKRKKLKARKQLDFFSRLMTDR